MIARLALAVAVIATALLATSSAFADGDPASDYLVAQDLYTPYSTPTPQATAGLAKSIRKVFARGLRIKVAVIATRTDLGSIPQLYGKPNLYARFLGTEIAQVYVGPLLIAMPSGFGIYDGGRTIAAEARLLARLKPDSSSAAKLVTSTTAVVERLLAAGALRSKDILPPSVYPRVPFAHAGESISLTYSVLEDSERSSEVITVLAGTDQLATFKISIRQVLFARPRAVPWTVPDPAPDGLQFCVVATDGSGNRGIKSCVPVKIS